MRTIGIVGYGPFTRLMIKYLQDDFDIVVYSREPFEKDKQGMNFEFAPVEQVLLSEAVILSIPSQHFEGFISENLSHFGKDSLIIDVASIKQEPVETMSRLLPKEAKILGTHPLFGPGSAKESLEGLQLVLCPVRNVPDNKIANITKYLEAKGIEVIQKSPKEHDDDMAYILGLTHLIGRAVNKMKIPDLELTTPAYEKLQSMRDIQGNHSQDLFVSIQSTDQARKVLNEFKEQIDQIINSLDK